MLGLVACELAPVFLDRGDVAKYALVHDLVEAYSGDTNTLGISAEGKTAKVAREEAAMERLRVELGPSSAVFNWLEAYERQTDPAARYVRLLDKVLPKLTHLLNHCAAPKALGFDEARFEAAHIEQYEALAAQYPEFPVTLLLLKEAMLASQESWKS
jgi:5'-deoxynucleotidase YfbR-like HD superfamily hydrolase